MGEHRVARPPGGEGGDARRCGHTLGVRPRIAKDAKDEL